MSEENNIPTEEIEVPVPETAPAPPLPPVEKPKFALTDEQESAKQSIINWKKSNPEQLFKLGGYAGTGKTTLIKAVIESFKDDWVAVCAFTGKAVNVLQRKGLTQAQTIHSLIYNVIPIGKGMVEFELKNKLDHPYRLIIIDESSMLSTELYEDLKSFGIKMLCVGDPGQLEPVGDNPNLMAEPDLVLSKIHRQAEHSPIITLANQVRQGGSLLKTHQEGLIVQDKRGFNIPMASQFDQVICAKNNTRREINRRFRLFERKSPTEIGPGDKIIVLRNNSSYGVFNGMILFVQEVLRDHTMFWEVSAHDEVDREFDSLRIWKDPYKADLGKEFAIPKYDEKPLILSDFGYCITCHKSQGSEWDKVLVWDEWMGFLWDMKRWRYTAITRAAKELVYCL